VASAFLGLSERRRVEGRRKIRFSRKIRFRQSRPPLPVASAFLGERKRVEGRRKARFRQNRRRLLTPVASAFRRKIP